MPLPACPFYAILASAVFALPAATQLRVGDVLPTAVEQHLSAQQPTATWSLEQPGASFLRLHFAYVDLDVGDRVEVIDGAGRVVQTFNEAHEDSWSVVVRDERASVRLSSSQSARGASFVVDAFVRGNPAALGSTCATECGSNIECVDILPEYPARRPVCLFSFNVGTGAFVGTGWLIGSPDCLITNWHNVDGATPSSMVAEFNYECDQCTGGTLKPTTSYFVESILTVDPPYDYALLDLAAAPAAVWGILTVNRKPPAIHEQMFVIHHSGGTPKGISHGRYTGFNDTPNSSNINGVQTVFEVAYDAQRAPGSSGSPAMCFGSNVVEALHHAGNGSGTCDDGYGIPMWLIVPKIEPILAAHGCSFQFVDHHCALCPSPMDYCVGTPSSVGCMGTAWGSGCPSMTDPDPFYLFARDVTNNKFGLIFFGFQGVNPIQALCGTVYPRVPLIRLHIQNSYGTSQPADCSGIFLSDFNAPLQAGNWPSLQAGDAIWTQSWYRDPWTACTKQSALGGGVTFVIAP